MIKNKFITEEKNHGIGAKAMKIMSWLMLSNVILWIGFGTARKLQIMRNLNFINQYIDRDKLDFFYNVENIIIEKSEFEVMIMIIIGLIINIGAFIYLQKILDNDIKEEDGL